MTQSPDDLEKRLEEVERRAERELTVEDSLAAVWRSAYRHTERRPLYEWITMIAAASGFAFAFWSSLDAAELGKLVRDTDSGLFQFVYGILAIVIAGFAIFSATATSETAKEVALKWRPGGGGQPNELKFMTLHYVTAFVPYLVYLALHFTIAFLGFYGGPLTRATTALGVGRAGAALMLAMLAGFAVRLLIVLQAFVFNVYNTYMTMVRFKIMGDRAKRQALRPPSKGTTSRDEGEERSFRIGEPGHDDDGDVSPPDQEPSRRFR